MSTDRKPRRAVRMWTRTRRPLLWAMFVQAAAWLVGLFVAQRLGKGNERTDAFRIAAICWGKKMGGVQVRNAHARNLGARTIAS